MSSNNKDNGLSSKEEQSVEKKEQIEKNISENGTEEIKITKKATEDLGDIINSEIKVSKLSTDGNFEEKFVDGSLIICQKVNEKGDIESIKNDLVEEQVEKLNENFGKINEVVDEVNSKIEKKVEETCQKIEELDEKQLVNSLGKELDEKINEKSEEIKTEIKKNENQAIREIINDSEIKENELINEDDKKKLMKTEDKKANDKDDLKINFTTEKSKKTSLFKIFKKDSKHENETEKKHLVEKNEKKHKSKPFQILKNIFSTEEKSSKNKLENRIISETTFEPDKEKNNKNIEHSVENSENDLEELAKNDDSNVNESIKNESLIKVNLKATLNKVEEQAEEEEEEKEVESEKNENIKEISKINLDENLKEEQNRREIEDKINISRGEEVDLIDEIDIELKENLNKNKTLEASYEHDDSKKLICDEKEEEEKEEKEEKMKVVMNKEKVDESLSGVTDKNITNEQNIIETSNQRNTGPSLEEKNIKNNEEKINDLETKHEVINHKDDECDKNKEKEEQKNKNKLSPEIRTNSDQQLNITNQGAPKNTPNKNKKKLYSFNLGKKNKNSQLAKDKEPLVPEKESIDVENNKCKTKVKLSGKKESIDKNIQPTLDIQGQKKDKKSSLGFFSFFHGKKDSKQKHEEKSSPTNETTLLIQEDESDLYVEELSQNPDHFIVVAIDFGTTFSGYAFSFKNEKDPSPSINIMRKWEGGDPGVNNQKTPTIILLAPDQQFHSFGFTARDFYHNLDAHESAKWHYFDKFKMVLHNVELHENIQIKAANGTKVEALKLFSMALKYFHDHALKELNNISNIEIQKNDIRWVITVPAIWKAPAKQFMRKAAHLAGITKHESSNKLLIALEPEVASIYIRKLKQEQLIPEKAPTFLSNSNLKSTLIISVEEDKNNKENEIIDLKFKTGTKYIVVDCGGGTVDITVHELERGEGRLKELYKASGGPFGSVEIDKQFELLLRKIFSDDFINSFKQKRPAGWVDLMIAFESKKRSTSRVKDIFYNISLPFSFIDFYKKNMHNTIEEAIRQFNDPEMRWSPQGMVRLSSSAMIKLFEENLSNIVQVINKVVENKETQGLEYLFLVGGFSESNLLQSEIRDHFNHKMKVIIPKDVSLTILKGAVCYGLDPGVVSVRRSHMTYGVGVVNKLGEKQVEGGRVVERDGEKWCLDIFDIFVRHNQPVGVNDSVKRRYAYIEDKENLTMSVYATERENVKYVTEKGVKKCATLTLKLNKQEKEGEEEKKQKEIETEMTFGDTEIKVEASEVATGHSVQASFDFFN